MTPLINPTLPTLGDPNATEDADVRNALLTIVNAINGGLDKDNLADALLETLGVSKTGTVRRGKSIIATEESRANAAFGLMTTPDRVSGLVVPADSLVCVAYSALWKESVAGAARAAIFFGATQATLAGASALSQFTQAAGFSANGSFFRPLFTTSFGLATVSGDATAADTASGQTLLGAAPDAADSLSYDLNGAVFNIAANTPQGGVAVFDKLPAGTYDFSIQFKASSGSVTVKNRKLRAWAVGF